MIRVKNLVSVLVTLAIPGICSAEVTVNSLFSDHAVLQSGIEVPVWGNATDEENITVEIAGQKVSASIKDGHWQARLAPIATGGPYVMTITGKNTITINDILVGEVWICSGQSNMEMPMKAPVQGSDEVKANANLPLIRQYHVPLKSAVAPIADAQSKWQVCSPETVEDFSAVGFFFGRELHKQLDSTVPVGLLFTSWSGTPAEAWTSNESLKTMPDFADAIKSMEEVAGVADDPAKFSEILENWYIKNDEGSKPESPWYKADVNTTDWQSMTLPGYWEKGPLPDFNGIIWFSKTIELPEDWAGKEALVKLGAVDDQDTTWINGVKIGGSQYYNEQRNYTVPASVLKAGTNVITVRVLDTYLDGGFAGEAKDMTITCPGAGDASVSLAGEWKYKTTMVQKNETDVPTMPGKNPNLPSVLYNGMIYPLQPYAIRGTIWYQGEANNTKAKQYQSLFPLMIKDWRDKWQQGNFPFLFVQIAPYWEMTPEIREAQLLTLCKSPNTAMTVTTDVGNAQDIHPTAKEPVGKRLALAALALAYNKDIVYSGPLYKEMAINGNKITLSFKHVGGGLEARDGELKGFVIAGADKQFKPAKAVIEGETVVVWSDEVAEPVAARYGWANVPDVNLYNKEGLPASPFRTDVE